MGRLRWGEVANYSTVAQHRRDKVQCVGAQLPGNTKRSAMRSSKAMVVISGTGRWSSAGSGDKRTAQRALKPCAELIQEVWRRLRCIALASPGAQHADPPERAVEGPVPVR